MADEEISPLQIGFQCRPPAGRVGDGDRSNLAEAAGAIDEYIEGIGLALDCGDKLFDLCFVGHITHMRFDAGTALRDGREAVCATCTNEDPVSLFGERMRYGRANPRTSAGNQDPQRPARGRADLFAGGCLNRFVNTDFVDALADDGTCARLEATRIGAADRIEFPDEPYNRRCRVSDIADRDRARQW